MAACYIALNLVEEAHRAVEEILRINPNFSLDYFAKMNPHKNQEVLDKFISALRKAGLPD
jgi:adenylate cyclase